MPRLLIRNHGIPAPREVLPAGRVCQIQEGDEEGGRPDMTIIWNLMGDTPLRATNPFRRTK